QLLDPPFLRRLVAIVREERPDAIVLEYVWQGLHATLASALTATPLIVDAFDVLRTRFRPAHHPLWPVVAAYERAVLARARQVLAISPRDLEEFARMGIARQRLLLVPGGVDAAAFHPDEAARARTRAGLGVIDAPPLLRDHAPPRRPPPARRRRTRARRSGRDRCGRGPRARTRAGGPYRRLHQRRRRCRRTAAERQRRALQAARDCGLRRACGDDRGRRRRALAVTDRLPCRHPRRLALVRRGCGGRVPLAAERSEPGVPRGARLAPDRRGGADMNLRALLWPASSVASLGVALYAFVLREQRVAVPARPGAMIAPAPPLEAAPGRPPARVVDHPQARAVASWLGPLIVATAAGVSRLRYIVSFHGTFGS